MRPDVLGYSAEARVKAALERIRGVVEHSWDSAQDAKAVLRDGLPFAPADARLYSVLGVLEQMDGRDAQAERLYRDALRLAPAEQNANLQLAALASAAGRHDEALVHIDLLLTRWQNQLATAQPILLAALADLNGRAKLIDILREPPPWRTSFFQRLATEPDTAGRLGEVVTAMHAAGVEPSDYEVRLALGALVGSKQVIAAYQLFLATLKDDERPLAGYVFDGDFTRPPSGRPFEWQARSASGVEISIPGGEAGARIAFRDVPVINMEFQQTLALAPGRYKIAVETSGEALGAPRGLNLALRCRDSFKSLLSAPLPLGDYRRRKIERDFETPAEECDSQIVAIVSGLTAESWALRQSGALIVHSVSLEPAER